MKNIIAKSIFMFSILLSCIFIFPTQTEAKTVSIMQCICAPTSQGGDGQLSKDVSSPTFPIDRYKSITVEYAFDKTPNSYAAAIYDENNVCLYSGISGTVSMESLMSKTSCKNIYVAASITRHDAFYAAIAFTGVQNPLCGMDNYDILYFNDISDPESKYDFSTYPAYIRQFDCWTGYDGSEYGFSSSTNEFDADKYESVSFFANGGRVFVASLCKGSETIETFVNQGIGEDYSLSEFSGKYKIYFSGQGSNALNISPIYLKKRPQKPTFTGFDGSGGLTTVNPIAFPYCANTISCVFRFLSLYSFQGAYKSSLLYLKLIRINPSRNPKYLTY